MWLTYEILCGWTHPILKVVFLELFLRIKENRGSFVKTIRRIICGMNSTVTIVAVLFGAGIYRYMYSLKNLIRFGYSFMPLGFMEGLERLVSRFSSYPVTVVAVQNHKVIADLFNEQGLWYAESASLFRGLLPSAIMKNKSFRVMGNIVLQSIYPGLGNTTGSNYCVWVLWWNLLESDFFGFLLFLVVFILGIWVSKKIIYMFDDGSGNKTSIKQRIYNKLIIRSESYLSRKADYRIVLSLRDKKRVEELYRVKVNRIIPLGIEDKFKKAEFVTSDRKCLLLGAFCEANLEGYQWFVDNVSPYLSCKTVIAGKGFEAYKGRWESENVSVLGYVENLNVIYSDASCVAIPLFSGAGMKVKTVEALMFGKTIFGTDEAYSGFEKNCGYLCNDAGEFIEKINNYISQGRPKYNEKARKIYEDFYSMESGKKDFEKILIDLKD